MLPEIRPKGKHIVVHSQEMHRVTAAKVAESRIVVDVLGLLSSSESL